MCICILRNKYIYRIINLINVHLCLMKVIHILHYLRNVRNIICLQTASIMRYKTTLFVTYLSFFLPCCLTLYLDGAARQIIWNHRMANCSVQCTPQCTGTDVETSVIDQVQI